MKDATASLSAALFGLDGFVVLAAADAGGELELLVQTTADLVGCPNCGAVARAKDRRPVWVRDLPVSGRPVVICWVKRVWSCPQSLCETRSWTEQHEAIAPRASLTERAQQRKVQLLTAAAVFVVLVIAVLLSVLLHQPAYLAPAVPAVASVAFLGTFIVTGRIRHSFTVSLVLVYMTMLGFFLTPDLSAELKGNTELAQVFNSLTPLVGTVVAFYLGADAAERIGTRDKPEALTRGTTTDRERNDSELTLARLTPRTWAYTSPQLRTVGRPLAERDDVH